MSCFKAATGTTKATILRRIIAFLIGAHTRASPETRAATRSTWLYKLSEMYPYSTKAGSLSGAVDKARTTQTHVGDTLLRESAVLGAGYSGEVKRVQDENGHPYALKVSNDKQIRFSMAEIPHLGTDRVTLTLPEASEFEKLRRLYSAGVPVPRPHAFQIHTTAEGLGQTSLLMELVKGQTLRDWLSDQPGGRTDKLSGRSIHPALSHSDAIARVDVALAIVSALLKLRRLGFFADFKPRNIMIREQRSEKDRRFSACLVDIGGVVLYQDISTHPAARRPDCLTERQSAIFFHPMKDRYLVRMFPCGTNILSD